MIKLASLIKESAVVATSSRDEDPIPPRFLKKFGNKIYILASVVDELQSLTSRNQKPLWFRLLAPTQRAFKKGVDDDGRLDKKNWKEAGWDYDSKLKAGGKEYYQLVRHFRIRR